MKSLVKLWLNGNRLSGTMPSGIFKIPALQIVRVNDNNLSGDLNDVFDDASAIPHDLNLLDLTNNKFSGSLPSALFEGSRNLTVFASGMFLIDIR